MSLTPKGSKRLYRALNAEMPPIKIVCQTRRQPNDPDNTWTVSSIDELKEVVTKRLPADQRIDLRVKDTSCGSVFNREVFQGRQLASLFVDKDVGDISITSIETARLVINCRDLTLEGSRILKCDLLASKSALVKGCEIGNMMLSHNSPTGNGSFVFENTRILSLSVGPPLEYKDLSFRNCEFSTKSEKIEPKEELRMRADYRLGFDRASLSKLYQWANSEGNSHLAHTARALELGVETSTASGLDAVILRLWRVFSNYGLSPARPLLWLVGAVVAFAFLLFCTGSSLGYGNEAVGWRMQLTDTDDALANFLRAIIGAFEGIVSPLSVFSFRRLIVPDLFWVAIVQVLYNYFCLTMVFLFGFAIRRRFRIA